MSTLKSDEIRQAVRERYAEVAVSDGAGCGCAPSCCGAPTVSAEGLSQAMGYGTAELLAVPEGANLGLGCGNPRRSRPSSPARPCSTWAAGRASTAFLAARQVGETGRVIGVDMTPEMLAKARANAARPAATPTSSSAWVRSSTCRWPTPPWT